MTGPGWILVRVSARCGLGDLCSLLVPATVWHHRMTTSTALDHVSADLAWYHLDTARTATALPEPRRRRLRETTEPRGLTPGITPSGVPPSGRACARQGTRSSGLKGKRQNRSPRAAASSVTPSSIARSDSEPYPKISPGAPARHAVPAHPVDRQPPCEPAADRPPPRSRSSGSQATRCWPAATPAGRRSAACRRSAASSTSRRRRYSGRIRRRCRSNSPRDEEVGERELVDRRRAAVGERASPRPPRRPAGAAGPASRAAAPARGSCWPCRRRRPGPGARPCMAPTGARS